MALTSNLFLIFILVCLLVYYLVPGRFQWLILLAASMGFYVYASPRAVVFILYTICVTFFTGRAIQSVYDEVTEKAAAKKLAKRWMLCGLLLDLGVLLVVKYTNFILGSVWTLFGAAYAPIRFLVPLGISYYTFQTLSYILDVYWKRAKAEKNIFRLALFVSFFPQLIQGPIGRYGKLAPQFAAEHPFSWHNLRFGLERVIWGMFKKVLIADWAAVYRSAIFDDPEKYNGIIILWAVLFSIELYGDFSGGIDIVLGIAEMFGIRLDENFRQPYFATSLTNFWQRWHISLGAWMKDYVFYPLAISKRMAKLGKKAQKVFGKKIGRKIPVCIANIIVFLLVGIWHGAEWHYVTWGLYNGIIISFSTLMEDVYARMKKGLHINDKSGGYRVFCAIRTFVIVNISWYFDCTYSFSKTAVMIRNTFTHWNPAQLLQIPAGKLGTAYTPYALLTLVLGCLVIFAVSFITERGTNVREALAAKPLAVSFVLFLLMVVCIALFSPVVSTGGFIYAQF